MSPTTVTPDTHRTLKITDAHGVLSFHVANIAVTDAVWLGNLIAMLCDPQHDRLSRAVREGRLALGFGRNSTIELIDHNRNQN